MVSSNTASSSPGIAVESYLRRPFLTSSINRLRPTLDLVNLQCTENCVCEPRLSSEVLCRTQLKSSPSYKVKREDQQKQEEIALDRRVGNEPRSSLSHALGYPSSLYLQQQPPEHTHPLASRNQSEQFARTDTQYTSASLTRPENTQATRRLGTQPDRTTICYMSYATPPAVARVRLFIASLGNPPPYHSTRHSAGHLLLKCLQGRLLLPALIKSKTYAGGHITFGSEVGNPAWTLFQSPTQMNISGTAVLKAYKHFQTVVQDEGRSAGETVVDALVLLHDEMEIAPSKFKMRKGNSSAKGHNGIKSVQSSLQSAGMLNEMSKKGKERYIKIGVGIGRPDGKTRERDDVSAYVLGQLSHEEKERIEVMTGSVIEALAAEIEKLSAVK